MRPNANESLPVDEVNEMSKASTSTTLTLDLRSQTISIGGGTKGCAGRRGKLGNENNQGLQLFSRGGGVGGCRIFKSRERVAAGTSGAIGKKIRHLIWWPNRGRALEFEIVIRDVTWEPKGAKFPRE